jgi:hypothetical protein
LRKKVICNFRDTAAVQFEERLSQINFCGCHFGRRYMIRDLDPRTKATVTVHIALVKPTGVIVRTTATPL